MQWRNVLERIRNRDGITEITFKTYFEPIMFLKKVENEVHLLMPDELMAQYLIKNYLYILEDEIKNELKIKNGNVVVKVNYPVEISSVAPAKSIKNLSLNPNFTFSNFVSGNSNIEAYTACTTVAKWPAQKYNPLYIYGSFGIGKTHLIQAIAHYLAIHSPEVRVKYMSGEEYVTEIIKNYRSKKIDDFRNKFRKNYDVLLIDDIQFLIGKEKSQEEFFHTFNSLHSNGKQIVITSNQKPDEIKDFDERLKSRLEWNLVIQIKPPEIELRKKIIRKKSKLMGLKLSSDAVSYIALNINESVRKIESIIAKIKFLNDLKEKKLNFEDIQKIVDEVSDLKKKKVTIDKIIKTVSSYFGIKESELMSKQRSKKITNARKYVSYFIDKYFNKNATEISKILNLKSHSNVVLYLRDFEKLLKEKNLEITKQIEEITKRLES